MSKIKLSKYLSREHSLFYCYVWQQSNQVDPDFQPKNIKNLLFLKKPGKGKTIVYYDLEELDEDFLEAILDNVKKDSGFMDKIIENYYRFLDKLIPYFDREILSLEELKEYYQTWIKWWGSLAVVFVTPNIEGMPEDVVKKALRVRSETEKYSDSGDRVFVKYFVKNFPKYKDIVDVITPDEVFSLSENELSKDELEKIRKRLDGFGFLNGEIYLLDELDDELKKQNLFFEKVKLSKYYSRERTLFYSFMWYDSDRLAFSNWFNHNLGTSFFLVERINKKTQIWYDPREINDIKQKIQNLFSKDEKIFEEMSSL